MLEIPITKYPEPPSKANLNPGRGTGRAAAIAYAREGADVAINYYPSKEPKSKRCGTRSDLDTFAGNRWRPSRKVKAVWRVNSLREARTASRASIHLCSIAADDVSYANGQVSGSTGGAGQP